MSGEKRVSRGGLLFAGAATVLPNTILWAQNQTKLGDPTLLVKVALVAGAIAAALAWLVGRFVPAHKAAIATGVAGYSFFSCSWIIWPGPIYARVTLWAIVTGVAAVIILWLIGDSKVLLRAGAVVMSVAVVGTAVVGMQEATVDTQALPFVDVDPIRTPNVYVFVLDGMGRPDVLADQFSLDISDGVQRLEEIGFESSSISTANYPRTHLSIPSMLNSDYPSTEDHTLTTQEEFAHADATLGGNNALVGFMKAAGYEYWHASSGIWGHGGCQYLYADRCIGAEEGSDAELRAAIWSSTPFGRNPFGADGGQDPTTVVDAILENRSDDDGPVFVISHIMSPHNPYRFTADCTETHIGSLVEGWQEKYVPEFKGAVECLMTQLGDAMTELVEDDPNALIMLVSDHGPAFGLEWGHADWTADKQLMRFANFRMVRQPDACRVSSEEAHSLVNTLPFLRACVTGEEFEPTEVRHYIVSAAGLDRLDASEAAALMESPGAVD